jgi:hypothetical protein
LSLGGSSPYTSAGKTNKNKYTQTKQFKNSVQTIQNTVNTSKLVTQTPKQLPEHPHIQTPHTHTHTHIAKPVKATTVQDTHQMK